MAKPAVFAELTFEAALARSSANHSVLIVDAMAAWCGPCRQMDATTWADSTVVARLTGKSPSFAIQIDVDVEQAIAAQLEVRAMPTLIAFRDGVEHDRLVGGRGPHDLLEWLDIVERGDRFEDAQRAARILAQERRTRAPKLLADKQYDEALVDYTWLWTNGRDDKLVEELRQLVDVHPPARSAFTQLRDATPPTPATPIVDIFEWLTLNTIIGDVETALGWYDANAADLPPSRALATVVEVVLLPLLISIDRWRTAGIALADPVATFHRMIKAKAPVRETAGNLVRALYAARRDERASDLEFEAESADPSPEMAAVLATAKQLGRA